MTKWLEQYKNTVLMIILGLFAALALCFIFFIRPLAAEGEVKKQELNRINEDVAFYRDHLSQLNSQAFTEEEYSKLIGNIPTKPNVEELIKDLEKAELKTRVVIENIGISSDSTDEGENQQPVAKTNEESQTSPQSQENGESQPDSESEANEESEGNTDTQPNQPAPQGGTSSLENILPKEALQIAEDKLKDVQTINISFVELTIDVNGDEKDVHEFVNEIENFKRIIHIQNYDYTIDKEKNNRLEGSLTIRAFYSRDFAKLIEDPDFKLDYTFDPLKLKRYIDITEIINSVLEQANVQSQTNTGTNNSGTGTVPQTGNSTKNPEPVTKNPESPSPVVIDPKYPVYRAPEVKFEGEPVFYVVQTGAYKKTEFMYEAVEDLIEEGIYPRIIGDTMSFFYTATDSNKDSAIKITELLKNEGIDSYVKTLPYRLTADEKESLLKESDDLVSTITGILTKGIILKDYTITAEQVSAVQGKIKDYEDKVQEVLKKEVSESRKQELQQTITILKQLDEELQKTNTNGNRESFWSMEGLLLDYMLILNHYVPASTK